MSRTARFLKDGECYYIESKGGREQHVFKMSSDFEYYIGLLKKYKLRFRVNVYAYCLTPTAARFIVYPGNAYALPLFMQGVNQSYALFYKRKYNAMGKVWGQRYKSVWIENNYDLFERIKSLEFIPVTEGRARSPIEYGWSSCASRILGSSGIIDFIPSGCVKLSQCLPQVTS